MVGLSCCKLPVSCCIQAVVPVVWPRLIDRELARFIYEIKRYGPFKFSIYAWWIKTAIVGSLAPVRLAWVSFQECQKMGLFMWRPILKNFMRDCSLIIWDHKFINASNFKLYLCGASDH